MDAVNDGSAKPLHRYGNGNVMYALGDTLFVYDPNGRSQIKLLGDTTYTEYRLAEAVREQEATVVKKLSNSRRIWAFVDDTTVYLFIYNKVTKSVESILTETVYTGEV